MGSGRIKLELNRPEEAKGMLTTAEMCQAWKCSTYYLQQCAKDGMPRKKISDAYFYDLAKCQEWYATAGAVKDNDKPAYTRTPKEAEGLLMFNELCEIWGCDRRRIYKYLADGMPAHKIKKRYFFNLEECQNWVRGENGESISGTKTL